MPAKATKLPDEPTRKNYNFYTTHDMRIPRMFWLLGLVLSIPCFIIAKTVFHQDLSANILFWTGMACYLPLFVTSTIGLWKTSREIKVLKRKMFIMETIMEFTDPKEYKRMKAKEGASKLFGGGKKW